MTCIFCRGNLSKKKVQEEIQVDYDHIMVEVEAEVCDNCHERYFPEGTVNYLQKLRKELKTKKGRFKPVGQVYQPA